MATHGAEAGPTLSSTGCWGLHRRDGLVRRKEGREGGRDGWKEGGREGGMEGGGEG